MLNCTVKKIQAVNSS